MEYRRYEVRVYYADLFRRRADDNEVNYWINQPIDVLTIQARLVGTTDFRLAADGSLVVFDVPHSYNGWDESVAFGADGGVWYTDNSVVRHLSVDGTVTEFPLLAATEYPRSITAGPDGNFWFLVGDNPPLQEGNFIWGPGHSRSDHP